MLKKKIKKIYIVFLICIFSFFFFFLNRSRSYEIQYQVNDITVIESYNKKEKFYKFVFQKNDQEYLNIVESKYLRKKRLIKNIEVQENDSFTCLFLTSKSLSIIPVCKKNEELISPHLLKEEELAYNDFLNTNEVQEDNYQNINIYSLNNKRYFLYDYQGYTMISNKEKKKISLFNKDVYTVPLTIQTKNDILIADYQQAYEFDTFYVVSGKNGKVKKLVLDKKIPFESYFLGSVNKYAYIVDKKNQLQYEIYPEKLKIRNISRSGMGKFYNNGTWEDVTMNSLVTNEKNFILSSVNYVIDKDILYRVVDDKRIKLSEQKVKEIVKSDFSTVYYLVDDSLYYYNDTDGEVLVLTNFEWNFNYKNMIYIF